VSLFTFWTFIPCSLNLLICVGPTEWSNKRSFGAHTTKFQRTCAVCWSRCPAAARILRHVNEGLPLDSVQLADNRAHVKIDISQVFKVNVQACNRQYQSCERCLLSIDPYCGWCVKQSRWLIWISYWYKSSCIQLAVVQWAFYCVMLVRKFP